MRFGSPEFWFVVATVLGLGFLTQKGIWATIKQLNLAVKAFLISVGAILLILSALIFADSVDRLFCERVEICLTQKQPAPSAQKPNIPSILLQPRAGEPRESSGNGGVVYVGPDLRGAKYIATEFGWRTSLTFSDSYNPLEGEISYQHLESGQTCTASLTVRSFKELLSSTNFIFAQEPISVSNMQICARGNSVRVMPVADQFTMTVVNQDVGRIFTTRLYRIN